LDLAILLASGEFIELLENSHIFVGPLWLLQGGFEVIGVK
jgi:hypothetical protein